MSDWDARYRDAVVDETRLARVLTENFHLLPGSGQALDLACGLGAHALRLARAGLSVEAWDQSPVAIGKLVDRAAALGLTVEARVRDVIADPPAPARFDLIVVSHFLERTLCPAIARALKPGGLLFYQTFSVAAEGAAGPRNPAFRLEENELLRLFPDLIVRVYREEGPAGATLPGEALLVAQRP